MMKKGGPDDDDFRLGFITLEMILWTMSMARQENMSNDM